MKPVKNRRLARGGWAAAAVLTLLVPPLCAQSSTPTARPPALLDNMDGAAPALRLVDAAAGVRVLEQTIQRGVGSSAVTAERVQLEVPAGGSARLAYATPPSRILEELTLVAWVWCNRPGAQLAATVDLPRWIDDRTGRPRRLLVRSNRPAAGGAWERLVLDNLPAALASNARVARAQFGGEIDERGAYVSQMVILAPGGPGVTEVWVDQIALQGVLVAGPRPSAPTLSPTTAIHAASASEPAASAPLAPTPAVPRIIQWQGEPFELLRQMGFDAVWMGRLPSEDELREARRLGLYVVAPPPGMEQLGHQASAAQFAGVLAWDLGPLAAPADLELAQQWGQTLERHDTARPAVLRPVGMTREASRIADVVMLGRPTLGSTQTWPQYAAWLHQQRRLARPGTPIWATIDTHCGSHYTAQLASLRGGAPHFVPASFRELSLSTTAAFAMAPRGFCFQSHASLAASDAQTRMRALALELTNLRLGLAEPWLASGKTGTAARSNRSDLTGLVLKIERSHLIVPIAWSGVEEAEEFAAGEPTTFVLPGVPESCDVYLLSISGPQRIRRRRVTGGLEVTVGNLPEDAFILLTEDGYAFSHVERYLRQHAPRAAQARVELAALRRQQAAAAAAILPPEVLQSTGALHELARVDKQLTAVAETIRHQDFAAAFARAAEAERLLDRVQTRLWQYVAPDLPAGVSPVPAKLSTLADGVRIARSLAQSPGAFQAIPGGEFENLDEMLRSGWERLEHPVEGVQSDVRLSSEAPPNGAYCLELEVRQEAADGSPPAVPRPPVWITSPPLSVPADHLIEITGRVRVPEAPIGSADPLLIFDSAGGEESALRIGAAAEWTPFRMVRVAQAGGGGCRVTIALGGVGRAQVDSLKYRIVPVE